MKNQKTLSYYGALIALLTMTSLYAVYAQTVEPVKVKVGDPIVSGAAIKPYKNLWQLTYSKPGREPIDAATWSDEVEAINVGGRALLKRTQVAKYSRRDITITTVNVFDPRTLAPISRDFKQSDGTYAHLDFGEHTIKSQRMAVPGGEVTQGQVTLDTPVFDFFGGMYGLLVAAFPLKEGFAATLPSLDESKDDIRWATFKVVRKEMVEAGAGKQVEAWVVETDDHGPMTFWLTKDAPYIIKLVYVAPGGVTATYTMI